MWKNPLKVRLFSYFFPSLQPLVILYLVAHLSGYRSVEKSVKGRILSHVSPSHEPLVIIYLVIHFSEAWKCGNVQQSQDIGAIFSQSQTPF